MTEVVPFSFEGAELRSYLVDGEPWFVAADVAAILGYRMASDLTRRLDDEDRGTRSVRTPSGDQDMTVISEPGLYVAVLGSQVPGAKAFKRWVTREVLPTIRRTGSFGIPREMSRLELIDMARDSEVGRIAAEAQLAIAGPKAEAFDDFLTAEGDYLVATVGNMLGIGGITLFRRLRDEHILICKGRRHNTPYQQYMHHFRVVPRPWEDSDGVVHTGFTTYVRPSGVDFIRKVLKLQALMPAVAS